MAGGGAMNSRVALGLALLATSSAAPAAESAQQVRASELSAPALSLAERLLSGPAPDIVEGQIVWNPGVAQWSSATAVFAPRARPTMWANLCQVDMRIVQLSFVEPRANDAILLVGRPVHALHYALTRPVPALRPSHAASAVSCESLTPFLNQQRRRLAYIEYQGHDADENQAAFAYRAVAASADAPLINTAGCAVDVEPRCRDGVRFLREVDLRDLWRMSISPCVASVAPLCVTALIENVSGDGGAVLVIETDKSEIGPPERPLHVLSARISATRYPVA